MAGNPQAVAAKWVRGMQNSTESIRDGVNAVTQAPGVAAAAAVELWAQRTLAAKQKYATRVAAVGLDEWKRKMLGVGLSRVSEGAAANEGKMAAFMSEFLPFQEQVTQTVRSMPKGSLEASIARMTAQVRGTAQFRRSGR